MSDIDCRATRNRTEKSKRLRRGQTVRGVGLLAAILSFIGFPFFLLNMPTDLEDLDLQNWIILIAFFTLPTIFLSAGYWCGFRCPFCERGFGSRTFVTPNFCRRCGENLEL